MTPPNDARTRLTDTRIALAIFFGVVTGAALTTLSFFLEDGDFRIIPLALMTFIVSAVIWFAGLLLIAGPLWALLHGLGVRSWWAGALLGAVLCLLISLLFTGALNQPSQELWASLVVTGGFSLIGGAVGLVVAATAYAKPRWEG